MLAFPPLPPMAELLEKVTLARERFPEERKMPAPAPRPPPPPWLSPPSPPLARPLRIARLLMETAAVAGASMKRTRYWLLPLRRRLLALRVRGDEMMGRGAARMT